MTSSYPTPPQSISKLNTKSIRKIEEILDIYFWSMDSMCSDNCIELDENRYDRFSCIERLWEDIQKLPPPTGEPSLSIPDFLRYLTEIENLEIPNDIYYGLIYEEECQYALIYSLMQGYKKYLRDFDAEHPETKKQNTIIGARLEWIEKNKKLDELTQETLKKLAKVDNHNVKSRIFSALLG